MKTNQSFFCRQQFFYNFSLTTLVTRSKFHVDDKKLLMRKSCRLHFASSVNSLTLSHSCQEKFSIIPVGSFEQLVGGMGPGDFRQLKKSTAPPQRLWVEKEEASTFQAADLATTVPLTCLQNYIFGTSKTNHYFKSFGKNISFLLYWIHKVKM